MNARPLWMMIVVVTVGLAVYTWESRHTAAQQPTRQPDPIGTDQPKSVPAQPTAGNRVDQALDSLQQGLNDATAAVKQDFARARDYVESMGTSARIYARLHWDKDLNGLDLRVDMPQTGVAVLSGVVPDGRAKSKVIRLTEDTVGVTRVDDQLSVTSPEPAGRPAK